MRRLVVATLILLICGSVSTADDLKQFYIMKVDGLPEIGKVVAEVKTGQKVFITCPGNQKFPIDPASLKPTALGCQQSDEYGPFSGVVKTVDAGTGKLTVQAWDGGTVDWNVLDTDSLKGLSQGTHVWLTYEGPAKNTGQVFKLLNADPNTM